LFLVVSRDIKELQKKERRRNYGNETNEMTVYLVFREQKCGASKPRKET
jgi:hypothetical protein